MLNARITLLLYIQPKASRETWVAIHDNELKIALKAPPLEGKANQALISFLAKQFKVPKSDITIIKGIQSRHKQVMINNPKQIPELVQDYLLLLK